MDVQVAICLYAAAHSFSSSIFPVSILASWLGGHSKKHPGRIDIEYDMQYEMEAFSFQFSHNLNVKSTFLCTNKKSSVVKIQGNTKLGERERGKELALDLK